MKTGYNSIIKHTLNELNKRDNKDNDAFAKTLVKHDDRITAAENDIKQLKLKSKEVTNL